ncbi:MAG: preprotein translocase subunit YajC [Kiritimatiellae bacterium]|nr:preprotein translocase subunit YajC [Kiritimatiellia bacterium]
MNNLIMLADAGGNAGAAGDAGAAVNTGAGQTLFGGPWVMMLIMIALFYFMFLRPQNRKERERRKMIEELRAGAKVIFAGGIIGTIAEANEKTFIVETTDGRMEIVRSAVQGVVPAEGPADPAK